jgi:hypothetical protein
MSPMRQFGWFGEAVRDWRTSGSGAPAEIVRGPIMLWSVVVQAQRLVQRRSGLRRVPVAALLMLAALGPALSDGPKMYRWTDESGVVHYTDQIPPNQVDKGHAELSKQGVRVEQVAPAQTIEEIQRERELERLRAQQERLVDQQKAADRVLLRTFRSVDDLVMARDGKLAAIDVVIQVARGNIRRQQDWLRKLRTDAADLERAGKPLPQHHAEGMSKTERQIRESYATIVDHEQQKEAIRQDFDRDLKRFRQLKDIPEDRPEAPRGSPQFALRNLVTCDTDAQCDHYWARAVAYVQARATTAIQASGSNIVITAPPETREDLSLTLSRIQEDDSSTASIFLDLQCKNHASTDTSCDDQRAAAVLNGFHEAVTGPARREALNLIEMDQ